MFSNYKFGLNRSRTVVPAVSGAPPQTPQPPVVARTSLGLHPRASVNVPVNKSNRFSINRIIHIKSSGGCRSCG